MWTKTFISMLITAFLMAVFINQALPVQAAPAASSTNGYILIQTEINGQAWYVYPKNGKRYFLGRPDQAFAIMKKLSLGAKHDFIIKTQFFPANLAGMILLDVESSGQAYYVYPKDLKKYYLGRPADAFQVMKNLGLGITDKNLAAIPLADLNNATVNIPNGRYLITNVPFTSQAPFGNWSDPKEQNSCEEAASLMAISWARGQTLTPDQALNEIIGISDFELKHYGEFHDTSAQDTLDRIIKDYFSYQNAELKNNVTIADMINELSQGRVLIAPMNGQVMGNPNFTGAGPVTHMAVVIGYDSAKRIFITNDPGTRRGQGYQYDINVFYNAMRDYPTGNHLPIKQIEKNIIVIKK